MCQMKGCAKPAARVFDKSNNMEDLAVCDWHYRTNTLLWWLVQVIGFLLIVGGPAALIAWMAIQNWAPIVPTAI